MFIVISKLVNGVKGTITKTKKTISNVVRNGFLIYNLPFKIITSATDTETL